MPTATDGPPKAAAPKTSAPRSASRAIVIASAVLPVLALMGVLAFFLYRGVGVDLSAPAPIERVEFERIEFQPGIVRAHVINTGPDPVTIAQVQVGWTNRASWEFYVSPQPTVPRLGRAVVNIPYPWIAGEPYEIVLITEKNLVFTHDVEIAAETPAPTAAMYWNFALLGIYVGVIPVFLGIGWLPFLRALPQRWYAFVLSLTVGLLVFLAIDSLHEALESSGKVPVPFQGIALIAAGVLFSILGLYAVTGWARKRQARLSKDAAETPLVLAYSVAFGIGVHNLGEGLAIGAAYALGSVAVGTMLIIGFTMHNLTEGVAVIAPIVRTRFSRWHLLWMGTLAGAPTIAGTILGGFTYSPVWAVIFLAIGAGAILQVVVEITRHQVRQSGFQALASGYSLAGLAVGFAVMYATGLLVSV